MPVNQAKYRNAILFLSGQLGSMVKDKQKLAKLLYFSDFDFFEKNERSITGDVYMALPQGPYPVTMEETINMLVADGILRPVDTGVFDIEEVEMLTRVCLKYGGLSDKQLENLTGAEAPYVGTELNSEIFYELAIYRGTDFSN
jgi:uncharacterized phage-associated protein